MFFRKDAPSVIQAAPGYETGSVPYFINNGNGTGVRDRYSYDLCLCVYGSRFDQLPSAGHVVVEENLYIAKTIHQVRNIQIDGNIACLLNLCSCLIRHDRMSSDQGIVAFQIKTCTNICKICLVSVDGIDRINDAVRRPATA